jgi:hypothetical protein
VLDGDFQGNHSASGNNQISAQCCIWRRGRNECGRGRKQPEKRIRSKENAATEAAAL